jgi:hypothetical protein
MEETGCSKSEAEFALCLSNNNIEKAIVKLGIIQKYIFVFKIKLSFFQDNFYGLFFIAINNKVLEVLKVITVFSRDPKILDIPTETDWFTFEKHIFATRLKSDTMEAYTKRLEEPLKKYFQRNLSQRKKMPDETMIKAFFNPLEVKIEVISEQINMTNFKKLPNFDMKNNRHTAKQNFLINLDVEFVQAEDGTPIEKILPYQSIMTIITDQRDIARYLKNLIVDAKSNQNLPIPAIITSIKQSADNFTVHVQYSSSIIAVKTISKGAKLVVIEKE